MKWPHFIVDAEDIKAISNMFAGFLPEGTELKAALWIYCLHFADGKKSKLTMVLN